MTTLRAIALDVDQSLADRCRGSWNRRVVRGRGYRADMGYRVGVWCEDCGIALSRHGSECGTEAGDPYSDVDYGRPGGWATPDDELIVPANVANLDY